MHHRKHLFTTLALLIGTHSMAVAATGWPSSARPTLTPKVTYEKFDGGEIEHLILEGAGVRFKTGNDVTLKQVDPDPRYSILFEHTRYPGSQVGLALFSRSEFLTAIESSAWDNYLSSLRYAYPIGLEIISDHGPEETAKRFPIMGSPYRELTYSYRIDEEGPTIIRREYIVTMKDKLLVGVVESAEPYFQPVSRSIRSLLVGMYQEN
ncbi:MAG: hypothetical protein DRP71_09200 [Verrucomicrobia bacterium]|nr:MAG: hypothetical protein DRP71_09200 [Verrucomicrobiota bacterium]